jgi:A/G-specific adenine glycosylase
VGARARRRGARPLVASAPSLDAGALRARLLRWYAKSRRELPWRATRDPYAIWISEAMLQQTRVETVIPYYERFLDRFPDVQALASAPLDDVLGEWAGLGYYSRARNLQAAAVAIVERFGGSLPSSVDELLTLPGVGRYTAGAVASIAFDKPEPVLDGNVIRVLARLLDLREDVAKPAVRERLWSEAAALARGSEPGDLNQALMELGATLCTPRAPRCDACPLRGDCAGLTGGDPEALPRKAPKSKPLAVRAVAARIERRGRALLVQRPARGLLAGLWELPGGELACGESPEQALRRALRERVGLDFESARAVGSVDHVFTHRRLELLLFDCGEAQGRLRLADHPSHRWVPRSELLGLPHSALHAKAVALFCADAPASVPRGSLRATTRRRPATRSAGARGG